MAVCESSQCVYAKPSIDSQSVAEATALTQQPYKVALLQTSGNTSIYLQLFILLGKRERQFMRNSEKDYNEASNAKTDANKKKTLIDKYCMQACVSLNQPVDFIV